MPRRAVLLAILLVALAHPAKADAIAEDIGARVADGFAIAATEAFAAAAGEMAQLTAGACAAGDMPALEAARAGFRELVTTWGTVSVLRFGPLQAENRFERVFFWPDPRGVIVRQTQGLIADEDEAALLPGALAAKSVAVQGLPALEYVLFGTDAEELAEGAGIYRCRYGQAVAANLAAIADAVAAEWRPDAAFYDMFAHPAADRAVYRSAREVASEVVKAAGTALQYTRNAELLPPMGDSAAKARGKRAPLWRSDMTFALIGARIEALTGLLAAAGFDRDEDAKTAIESMRFDLAHARAALDEIEVPAEEAFSDAQKRERLAYVAVALEGANRTLGEKLSAALGLTMGFNALDGD